MVRLQEKLRKATGTITFFLTKEFKFCNNNVLELYRRLSPQDKQTFCFDINGIDWQEYIETYVMGTRRYILKEDPSSLPESRTNLRKLYLLHRATQLLMFTFVFWGVVLRSNTARSTLYQISSILFRTLTSLSRAFASGGR
ncbi:unnamed protein product [Nesidiocoris tenuis]|nr:unnamed protein product [Nesidiocoris tenuis]